jgi:hypothetical protein
MKKTENENLQERDDYLYLTEDNEVELMKAIKLSKDIKTELMQVDNISRSEIRTVVDMYYQVQDMRKAIREQIRAIEQGRSAKTADNKEANVTILKWILSNVAIIEKGINESLQMICESNEVGHWLLSINGIGPILAAGLLGYLDVEGRDYATQFISYAGLNDNNRPWLGAEKSRAIVNEVVGTSRTVTDDMVAEIAMKTQWPYSFLVKKAYVEKNGKGKWSKDKLIKACSMIPYNKELKTHMYKVGSSFQWLCNNPNSLYGKLFTERRNYEMLNNESGKYAEQAKRKLEEYNIDKSTKAYEAYSQGKLPAAHINARAMRWTEKIFLSHLFEEMYRVRYDKIPPRYYSIDKLGEEHNKDIAPEVPFTLVSGEK